MKCPICENELIRSKKYPDYALCHSCRKKFKLPKTAKAPAPAPAVSEAGSPVLDSELTEQTQIFSREEIRAALQKANAERKAQKAAQKAARGKTSADASGRTRSSAAETAFSQEEDDDVEYHFRYANIPPKAVREKQEREMRKAYDELLSIGKEERSAKKHGLFGRKK